MCVLLLSHCQNLKIRDMVVQATHRTLINPQVPHLRQDDHKSHFSSSSFLFGVTNSINISAYFGSGSEEPKTDKNRWTRPVENCPNQRWRSYRPKSIRTSVEVIIRWVGVFVSRWFRSSHLPGKKRWGLPFSGLGSRKGSQVRHGRWAVLLEYLWIINNLAFCFWFVWTLEFSSNFEIIVMERKRRVDQWRFLAVRNPEI